MKAVLFDHDGVLADSEAAFFQATRETLARAGVELRPEVWARIYLGEGRRSRDVALELGVPRDRVDAVIASRDAVFRERLAAGIALMPGARETVEALSGRLRLAIVTGCPRSQLGLIHGTHGLLRHFECIVTGDDVDQPKPHPEAYVKALDEMGLSAAECVAVEDSPRGLASASAAGLRCVLIPTELTDLTLCTGAWRVLKDLTGLPPIVA